MYDQYPYDRGLQHKLAALFIRKPARTSKILEPGCFTHPVLMDIMRLARDAYVKHQTRLSASVLRGIVRDYLSGARRMGVWPLYKKTIRKLYKEDLRDASALVELAGKFSIDQRYRQALVAAERDINNGVFENVHRRFEQLHVSLQEHIGPTVLRWKDIPLASEATEENLEWLAAARIPAKQVTVIAAHKDSYKTMLMLRLAKAATSEGEFLGRRTKQMRVLYLNREMPKAVFDSYCKTIRFDKTNKNFRILSSLWDTGIKPPAAGDELLRRLARRYKPLIVFDSFIRFFPAKMEDPKAINNFMEQLSELAALGATVVILHHLPKHDATSEGYGSVYILNGADFGWRITIDGEKYAPEEKKVLRVQNTKTKMGDYFSIKVRPLLKTTGDFKVIDEQSQWKEEWEQDVAAVKRLFARTEWSEKREARREAMGKGMSRTRFDEIFEFCVERGFVRVQKGPRGLKRCRVA